jgi:hypothetical protein
MVCVLLKVADVGDYKRRFYGCANRLFQRSITEEPVEIKDGVSWVK